MKEIYTSLFHVSAGVRQRLQSIHYKTIYWIVVGILIIFMLVPREYAFAQGSGETPATAIFPYTKTFVITGYYSPLPDQSIYITGSYEAEIRLNGRGTNGADGTQVYPGMIAAPKEFSFGTKMKIPGIGVTAVHDRGGAIKQNRLDIWMGKGEEGLARALAWGKRSVEVTVIGIDESLKEAIAIEALPKADLSRIRVAYNNSRSIQKVYKDLAYGESGEEVRLMQEYLSLLNYFKEKPTGYFGESTQAAVIEFQLDSGVINASDELGAGIFGPRTREIFDSILEKNRLQDKEKIPTEKLYKGITAQAVQDLNYFLSELGYLQDSHAVVTRFDNATEEALKRFQFDMGVIGTDSDVGAGVYGPKTQAVLQQIIENRWNPGRKFAVVEGSLTLAFSSQLEPGQQSLAVQEMQRMLRDLHFLGIEPNGYYGRATEHAVKKFQQAFSIISTENDDGAGIFGPRTIAQLNTIATLRNEQKQRIGVTTDTTQLITARLNEEKTLVAAADISTKIFSEHATYGIRNDQVERLQKLLKHLGFFPGKVTTDYFGDVTKKSLLAFQKSHGLAESGELDEQTRSILNQLIL